MDNVVRNYSLKSNAELVVCNSGYNYKKKGWKSITGNAKFRDNKNTAALNCPQKVRHYLRAVQSSKAFFYF